MDRLDFVMLSSTRMVLKLSRFQRACRRQKEAVKLIRSVQYKVMVVNVRSE